MKAIIFGRRGFLGKALARHIDHSDEDKIYINCAARVAGIGGNQENPALMIRDNLASAIRVFDQAVEMGMKRVVNFGSVCSYSPEAKTPFAPEDFFVGKPEQTNLAYGMAKRAIYVMSEAYSAQYDMDNLYLVLPNLYGPGDHFDRTSHVIPSLIQKIQLAMDANEPSVTFWGMGCAEREFMFIYDAANLICKAIEKIHSQKPIHLGPGHTITIRDLAHLLCDFMGYHGNITWDANYPDGQMHRQLKPDLICENPTRFVDGLSETIAHFRNEVLDKQTIQV